MHSSPRYLLWLIILILSSGSLLSACGQKGDLYLPDSSVETEENQKKKQ